jgi:hypothetical protein
MRIYRLYTKEGLMVRTKVRVKALGGTGSRRRMMELFKGGAGQFGDQQWLRQCLTRRHSPDHFRATT